MRLKTGIIAGGAAFAAGRALAALNADQFNNAYARLRADESYQFDFPATPPPQAPPDWLEAIFKVVFGLFRALAPLFQIIFWLGLALIAAGAIYFIGREIYRFAQKSRQQDPNAEREEKYRPAPELARALLEEADRLAAEGRYGDAVHVLLFKSIEDIQEHRPNRVKIAMTSREISKIPVLSASAAAAFAEIARAVEACRFAGEHIGADIFADCRNAYLSFAAAEEWA